MGVCGRPQDPDVRFLRSDGRGRRGAIGADGRSSRPEGAAAEGMAGESAAGWLWRQGFPFSRGAAGRSV